jgi:hypothetical protein
MENMQIDEEFEETDGRQNREKQKKQPIIETSICKSKDGKWLMYIKPVTYFEKVLKGERIDEFGSHK